jgi:hypothetical protein
LKVSIQQMLDALLEVGGKERRALVEEKYDVTRMNQVLDNSVRRADPHLRFPGHRQNSLLTVEGPERHLETQDLLIFLG